jgi:hypothetical protein
MYCNGNFLWNPYFHFNEPHGTTEHHLRNTVLEQHFLTTSSSITQDSLSFCSTCSMTWRLIPQVLQSKGNNRNNCKCCMLFISVVSNSENDYKWSIGSAGNDNPEPEDTSWAVISTHNPYYAHCVCQFQNTLHSFYKILHKDPYCNVVTKYECMKLWLSITTFCICIIKYTNHTITLCNK